MTLFPEQNLLSSLCVGLLTTIRSIIMSKDQISALSFQLISFLSVFLKGGRQWMDVLDR